MEEDIKILKEFTESSCCLASQEEIIECVKNLIKGYRELEEKLDNSRKANELLNKTNNELRWEIRTTYSKAVNDIISKFNLGDEYIPKSKIKEKIEELEKLKNKLKEEKNEFWIPEINNTIYHIHELMEE